MSRAVSWSGDAEVDLRDAARRAARRDGLSLGEWLDVTVAQRAADLGVDPADLGSEDRISAVSDRLRDLASAPAATGMASRQPAPRGLGQAQGGRATPTDRDDEEALSKNLREERRKPIAQVPASRSDVRSLARSSERGEDLEFADGDSRKRSALVTRDRAESEEFGQSGRDWPLRIPAPAASSSEDLDDLSKVEAKLTALFRALDRKPIQLADKPARGSATAKPLRGSRPASREAASAAGAVEQPRTVLHRLPTAGPSSRTMAQAIAEIAERQAVLDRAAAASASLQATADVGAKGEPSELADRSRAAASDLLERFGSRLNTPPPRSNNAPLPAAPDVLPAMALLRSEIAALSQSLGGHAPKDAITSLEAAVRDLSAKVAASRDGGLRDVVLAPVERLARDLRAALKELDPRSAVKDLDREIRALGRNIENVTTQGMDADALRRIQEQTTEVRDLLVAAATRPLPADRTERQGAERQAAERQAAKPQSDAQTPVQARSPEPTADTVALADLRSMLNGLQPAKGVEVLEQRVDALAAKIDAAIAGQLQPGVIDELSSRIENVHASLVTRLAEPAAPPPDLAPVEAMIHGLIGRFDSMRQDAGDLRSLEAMVHRLAAKLDDAHDQHADAEVFGELQAQVAKLAARIDRSDAGLTAIVSVERSLGELFAQLEETREATINAAEGAARTAARDTLRAAMLDTGLPGRQGTSLADETVEHVTQELHELRAAREIADQRLNVILTAVNQTLEQVVARLAILEEAPAAGVPLAPIVAKGSRPGAPNAAPSGEGARRSDSGRPDRDAAPATNTNPGAKVRGPIDRSRQAFDLGEPDFPIEPGTSAVRPRAAASGSGAAPDVKADPAQFIAAARRAAQAAASDSANRSSAAAAARARGTSSPSTEPARSLMERAKLHAAGSRRPLLISLAGLVLLLGAAQVARLSLANPVPLREVAAAPASTEAGQAPAAPSSVAPATVTAKSTASVDGAAVTPETDNTATTASAPAKPLPSLAMAAGAARAANPSGETPAGLGDGLRDMALDGNAAAQYEVGLRLADGRGVTRDPKTAAGWFEKAARQGLAPAAYRLGSLYEKGIGVARDPAQAVDWYQKAAEAGNVRAMHNLAVMSAEGAGGKSDYVKAAQWFTKASQMGVRDSQFNLAILYARGLGIEQSLAESYKWFAIAAAQGDTDAAKKRDDVAARLDAKALAAAKAAADDFKPIKPLQAANDVQAPPGGWDAVAPTHAAPAPNGTGKSAPNPRVSTL